MIDIKTESIEMFKMKKLKIRRIFYGNEKTPVNEREYKAIFDFSSPTGTVAEWSDWAKEKGYSAIEVTEKDGSKYEIEVI